ncbi:hypothetical protein SAMN05216377_116118 [Pseudonocardia oroxyli]|uniref:Uncharacterized protein n=1 Tax=Pseudonocardia oroxyli TaxID=366584 RepID=A0A1G7XXF2_PSEOR|nr:hypothetical protein SAMN05216377_116118 [Pseudonocardia oroxyli]
MVAVPRVMGTEKHGEPNVSDPREQQELSPSDLPDDDHDDTDTAEQAPCGRRGDGPQDGEGG